MGQIRKLKNMDHRFEKQGNQTITDFQKFCEAVFSNVGKIVELNFRCNFVSSLIETRL